MGKLGASSVWAEALSARMIMEKANLAAFYQGDDGRAEARMKIVDGQGREQVRQFVILRKDLEDGANQWFYVLFRGPQRLTERPLWLKNKS